MLLMEKRNVSINALKNKISNAEKKCKKSEVVGTIIKSNNQSLSGYFVKD